MFWVTFLQKNVKTQAALYAICWSVWTLLQFSSIVIILRGCTCITETLLCISDTPRHGAHTSSSCSCVVFPASSAPRRCRTFLLGSSRLEFCSPARVHALFSLTKHANNSWTSQTSLPLFFLLRKKNRLRSRRTANVFLNGVVPTKRKRPLLICVVYYLQDIQSRQKRILRNESNSLSPWRIIYHTVNPVLIVGMKAFQFLTNITISIVWVASLLLNQPCIHRGDSFPQTKQLYANSVCQTQNIHVFKQLSVYMNRV